MHKPNITQHTARGDDVTAPGDDLCMLLAQTDGSATTTSNNDRQLISGTSKATNLHYILWPVRPSLHRTVGHGKATHISYLSLSDQSQDAQRNAASDLFMMHIL